MMCIPQRWPPEKKRLRISGDFRKRPATRRQIGRPDREGWRSPAAVSLLTRFPRVRPTHILVLFIIIIIALKHISIKKKKNPTVDRSSAAAADLITHRCVVVVLVHYIVPKYSNDTYYYRRRLSTRQSNISRESRFPHTPTPTSFSLTTILLIIII